MPRARGQRQWTVTASVFTALAVVLSLTLVMAVLALNGLQRVVDRKDRVIDHDAALVLEARTLMDIRDARAAANRGYLFSGQTKYLGEQYKWDEAFNKQLTALRQTVDTDRGRDLVDQITRLQASFIELDKGPVQLKEAHAPPAEVVAAWEEIDDQRVTTTAAMDSLFAYLQGLVREREQAATRTAHDGVRLIVASFVVILIGSTLVASMVVRQVRGRVMTAVRSVQQSSTDLQLSARQQAEGASQQASSAAEISTTVKEMLAESRLIAEGAQDVVAAAGQTAEAGRHGRDVVLATQSSMERIRAHSGSVDQHMEDLSRRARQITGVVEIVSELAELTNIVAINASIEAAGAGGEASRFAALADEIRALADRVGGSTREIGEMVASVATAVDDTRRVSRDASDVIGEGAAQVGQAVESFEEIVSLVANTMESARQIQQSTSQQSVAVEQTDLAISAMAEATRAHQATAGDTQTTADQLASLSHVLGTLVQSAGRDTLPAEVR
ncbi:methyl-accepting chemotaxis protein [Kineosporia sp. J2-2]|uniref:Methyl-accepting chemotaxis protein n=1 Tax=Kineosporia corallincola TaxID=2835133 RepID=A0ABS5TEV9_9ACTN|nr:methyl-accepting chemotaxis protein [Kineosporia corallincola]MBT0769596.1 methyl-accepting chemotaxis protein [Kineosporia corallincola]